MTSLLSRLRTRRRVSQRSNRFANPESASSQVLDMIKYGRVRSLDAIMVRITAETVCIHGDGPQAVQTARAIHDSLTGNGIAIKAING